MHYPIYTPEIRPYTTSLLSAIESGWVSSQGEFIDKTRNVLQKKLEVPYVVLTNNGTSSTHLLYMSLKFKYPELKRIYLPNYVFVAVWNCALYEYPVEMLSIMETDSTTLNMREDEEYIMSLEPNAAVVVVHNVGNVVNVPRLKRLRPDLIFVEDSCEAFMERYEDQVVGTASLCSALSFFANKMITSGEGGAFYTSDPELYAFIYKTCHHGHTNERYIYDTLGYNYRMTNLQAALLYDQLQDLDTIILMKTAVYYRYVKLFPVETATSGIWMFTVRLNEVTDSKNMYETLAKYGVDLRPMFYNINKHAHLKDLKPPSDTFHHEQIVMLPSSSTLKAFDQVYIAMRVKQYASKTLSPLDIVEATPETLTEFASQTIPSTFRYFKNRTVPDCMKCHVLTILGLIDGKAIGYAHIDYELGDWVGICILPEFQSKGYGRILMNFVIDYARVTGIQELKLTVDLENEPAIKLYNSLGFIECERTANHFLMKKSI
jgi:perosamine synthetase